MIATDDIHAICTLPGWDEFPALADLRLILYHVERGIVNVWQSENDERQGVIWHYPMRMDSIITVRF